MNKRQSSGAISIAILVVLVMTVSKAAAEDVVMQFGDNINPAPNFPSSINSTPFEPGTELRFIAPDGNIGGGGPKDVLTGAERWVFAVTGELMGVNGTQFTGDAGFPITVPGSGCPDGCDGISQSAPFFGVLFGFVAPFIGNPAGTQYGPAMLAVSGAGSFEVFFPVLEGQWAGTYFPLGIANNQGVTFDCTGSPDGNFRCHMEHTFQVEEDPGAAGFPGWTVQMEFTSVAAVAVGIDIDGGMTQECTRPEGDVVTMNAAVNTPSGAEIASISWDVDGAFFSIGETIQPTLGLGSHTVEVTVHTTAGDTASDSVTVTVVDTIRPTLVAAFKDRKTGETITTVSGANKEFVEVTLVTEDACEPDPQLNIVSATLTPTYKTFNGDVLEIKPKTGKAILPITAISLNATARDAAGNTTSASAVLEIISD
jgi:hypothetical protein